jgi:flagellar motor switch/type III secretory pathway protein FliN
VTKLESRPTLVELRKPTDVWNAIMSRCGATLPLAAKGVAAVVDRATTPEGSQLAALTACDGLRLVVLFDTYPFKDLFDANIEATDLDVLPPELRDVLVEGMISTLWSLIPQNELTSYSILSVGKCRQCVDAIEQPLDWFSVSISGMAPRPAAIRVGCVAVDVARLLTGGAIASRATWAALSENLTFDAYFSLPSFKTTVEALRTIGPGDVIILNEDAQDRLHVCIDRRRYEFTAADEGWTCLGLRHESNASIRKPVDEERLMTTMPEEAQDECGPIDIGDLPVDLDFDIGERRIPLSEVETWTPGSLVVIDPPEINDEITVTIRANGKKIAIGDLVKIDERLAVRLTRLLIRA